MPGDHPQPVKMNAVIDIDAERLVASRRLADLTNERHGIIDVSQQP
jgi:hypothetical protein